MGEAAISCGIPVMSGLATFSEEATRHDTPRPVHIVCSRVFREGLKQLLRNTGTSFTEGSSTIAEAIEQMGAGNVPDLVIAVASVEEANNDIFLSIRLARARFPQTRWLLLTDKVTPEHLRKAAAAGIDGLLPHEISGRVLVHAAELLLLGQPLLPLRARLGGSCHKRGDERSGLEARNAISDAARADSNALPGEPQASLPPFQT